MFFILPKIKGKTFHITSKILIKIKISKTKVFVIAEFLISAHCSIVLKSNTPHSSIVGNWWLQNRFTVPIETINEPIIVRRASSTLLRLKEVFLFIFTTRISLY